jgi:hypothetical protein
MGTSTPRGGLLLADVIQAFNHLHKICRVLDAEGISRGLGKHFPPLSGISLTRDAAARGFPHLTHPFLHFLYDPGPYVAVVYCGRFIFGQAEPPPLVNQTGGFHSADGTDPKGGSFLHWTYIS